MNDPVIFGTKIGCSSQVEQKIQTKPWGEIRKFWSRNISVDFAKIPAGVHTLVLDILARVKNLRNHFLKQIKKL